MAINSNSNSVVTLNASNLISLCTSVTVWPSMIHTAYNLPDGRKLDTYGEPSLIRVDAPSSGKLSKLTLRTERAREIRAALSAAEATMEFAEIKDLKELEHMANLQMTETVMESKWDETFKANSKRLVQVAHDPTYKWHMDANGFVNSNLILFAQPRMRKGEMHLGVINTCAWQGAHWLDLTVAVTMPNGNQQMLNKMIACPAHDGFQELNWKDGLYLSPLADLGDENKDYRTSFYRFLKCLADGESFIIKCNTYLDRQTMRPNTYISSKAVQLVARSKMTVEEIAADKQRIMQNMFRRQQERQTLAVSKALNTVPDALIISNPDTGELVGRVLETAVMIRVNGKDVAVKDGTEIPDGQYELIRGLRNDRVRTITIKDGISVSAAQLWASNHYGLRSLDFHTQSIADLL